MANPLEKFFKVEERDDGIYIAVPPEMKGKIDPDRVRRALETGQIINYQWDIIEDVISRATGEYEPIGPPFEQYDGALDRYVEVSISDMQASMKIDSNCIADNVRPSLLPLLCCLRRKGICYGILREKAAEILKNMRFDTYVEIARGKEPVDGEDAKLDMQVNLNPDTRPHSRGDGSVDYRNIESFVQIGKGQVLAVKIPPTQGIPGKKVTGEEIPPTPGNDIKMPQGKNTIISDDGSRLIAACSGVLNQYGQLLQILEVLMIEKDVDFRVGNIKYSGDITIKGNVQPGFCVEADGNVTIKGIVETAQIISRNGKAVIEAGVIGKEEAEIYGKAGVYLAFCQEAKCVETEGMCEILKHCLHSKIKCAILGATDNQSSVVGGEVSAYDHVEVRQLGNDSNVETKISIVDKNLEIKKEKLSELENLKTEMLKKKEPIEKNIKAKAAIVKKAGNAITDRQRNEMKTWIDTYNAMNMKLKYIDQQIDKIKEAVRQPGTRHGYIKVSGDIYPGVILSLYGNTKIIKNRMTNKTFRVTPDGLEAK
ncbi:MAG: DUF342 domain-containing protein [Chitinivibrionales bacterium]|nr:DUF342 domain-containing protein [Chitinivibrionales bacterium]